MPTVVEILDHAAWVLAGAFAVYKIPLLWDRPNPSKPWQKHSMYWRWGSRLGYCDFAVDSCQFDPADGSSQAIIVPHVRFWVQHYAERRARQDRGDEITTRCVQAGTPCAPPRLRSVHCLATFKDVEGAAWWLAAQPATHLQLAGQPPIPLPKVSYYRGGEVRTASFRQRKEEARKSLPHTFDRSGLLRHDAELDDDGRLVSWGSKNPWADAVEEPNTLLNSLDLQTIDRGLLAELLVAGRTDVVARKGAADYIREHGVEALCVYDGEDYLSILDGQRGGTGKQEAAARTIHLHCCREGVFGWETEPETAAAMRLYPILQAFDLDSVSAVRTDLVDSRERAKLTRKLFRDMGLPGVRVSCNQGIILGCVNVHLPSDFRLDSEFDRSWRPEETVRVILDRAFPAYARAPSGDHWDDCRPVYWSVQGGW